MNALLSKDLYLLARQNKFTAIFMLVFLFVGATGGTFYGVIVSIVAVMLPLSTIAYDQMHHWDRFAIALPIARSLQVTGKYVLALMLLFASVVLMLMVGILFMIFGKGTIGGLLVIVLTQISAGLSFMAVNYPIVIKLGFKRGRIWYLIITVAIVALGSLASSFFSFDDRLFSGNTFSLAWLLVPVFLVWLSHKLSVSFMEHKEF